MKKLALRMTKKKLWDVVDSPLKTEFVEIEM